MSFQPLDDARDKLQRESIGFHAKPRGTQRKDKGEGRHRDTEAQRETARPETRGRGRADEDTDVLQRPL